MPSPSFNPFPALLAGAGRRWSCATLWVVYTMCCLGAAGAAELTPAPRDIAQLQQAPQRTTPPDQPQDEAEQPSAPPPPEQEAIPQGQDTEQQPWPPQPGPDEAAVSAERVRVEADRVIAEGDVTVKTEDLTVTADQAIIDEEGEWAEFSGDVAIDSETHHSTTQSLRVNLDTEEWLIAGGRTRVEPEFFEGGEVLEPLFLRAKDVVGESEAGPIHARGGLFTSCDLERPHFDLRSKHITVLPGRKVRIRKPTLYLFGHRTVRYPFDLTFDLDRKQNRFFPEIGQSYMEGYYAKLAYLYLAGRAGEGFIRLHMTQKRGLGFGVDHTIDTARQFGQGSIFFEPSQGAFTTRVRHRYNFSQSLSSDFSSSYQVNSGYFGSSSTLASNLTLRRRVGNTRSELGLQRSITKGTYSTSERFSANLRQEFGPSENRWSLRTAMRDSRYRADQPADKELETELRWVRRGSLLDWEAMFEDRWDLDGDRYTGDSNRFFLSRMPEFVIKTDSERLEALNLFGRVDSRAALYLGRFSQAPDELSVYRASFDGRFGGREYRLTGNSRLRHELQFRQSFYSDGSAQYASRFTTQLRQHLSSHWDTRLSYNYSGTHGYSPLRLDYSGRSHSLYWQAVRTLRDHSRLELSTGLDLISDTWRDALLRYELMTSRDSKIQLQSGYSLNRSRWRPANLRWIFASPDRYYLALGTNYDLDSSELTRATMELDWRWHRFWRIELLTGYSGYSGEFDDLDVQLTRDLHCWIGSLSYNKQLKEIRLNLGIKAFPANERILGIGRSGARFEGSTGQYF